MPQNEIAISVQGLQKSYKNIPVLSGVDFQVKTGSIFALLGSNGAGKTTIIKILATLLKPDSGTVTVNGFDAASKPDYVRQSISLTGQFAAVDEVLTGRENLIMIAKLRHLENPCQAADGLLKRFGLLDAANRRTSTYSGGMRRRLDIAMSLMVKPQIIFLDEPTTGLDPEARLEVWKIIKELAGSGISYTAYRLFIDMQRGIFERFHSMPIARSTVLWGHVLTSLLSNAISVVVIILVALVMGFRSPAGVLSWLAVAGILALFTLALTWIAVIAGLSAKSIDGASAFSYPIVFLPFISSAFVPTESMLPGVRAFAENQPVTSIVETIRALLANQPAGPEIWTALAWCLGIMIVAYIFAMKVYKKRV